MHVITHTCVTKPSTQPPTLITTTHHDNDKLYKKMQQLGIISIKVIHFCICHSSKS